MGKEKFAKNLFTIPNALSVIRILLSVGFCITYFTDEKLAALVILVITGITDVLDGRIARKYNQVSDFGKILDPFADKLFTVSTVVCICVSGIVPVWLLCIIIVKEIVLIVGGLLMIHVADAVIPSRWYGKATTVLFFGSFFLALLFEVIKFDPQLTRVIITAMIGVATALAIYSVINYIIIAVNIYKKQQKKNSEKSS